MPVKSNYPPPSVQARVRGLLSTTLGRDYGVGARRMVFPQRTSSSKVVTLGMACDSSEWKVWHTEALDPRVRMFDINVYHAAGIYASF